MTLAYLTDGSGAAIPLEDVPADVVAALAAKGFDLVEGFLPAGDGKNLARVTFSLDKAAEAERITAAAERFLLAQIDDDARRERLAIEGHRVNRGLLAPAYQPPTESESRQRRRWIARKARK